MNDTNKEIDADIKISPHLLNGDIKGLTSEEAEKLIKQYGLNAIKEQKKVL